MESGKERKRNRFSITSIMMKFYIITQMLQGNEMNVHWFYLSSRGPHVVRACFWVPVLYEYSITRTSRVDMGMEGAVFVVCVMAADVILQLCFSAKFRVNFISTNFPMQTFLSPGLFRFRHSLWCRYANASFEKQKETTEPTCAHTLFSSSDDDSTTFI